MCGSINHAAPVALDAYEAVLQTTTLQVVVKFLRYEFRYNAITLTHGEFSGESDNIADVPSSYDGKMSYGWLGVDT